MKTLTYMTIHKEVKMSANASAKKKRTYKDFEVTIFGLTVPIKFVPHVYDRQGNTAAGIFMRDDQGKEIIFISTEDNETHKSIVETLFHEMAHACIYRLGLHNTNLCHNVEEAIVDGFGVMLAENFDFDF